MILNYFSYFTPAIRTTALEINFVYYINKVFYFGSPYTSCFGLEYNYIVTFFIIILFLIKSQWKIIVEL